MDLVRANNFLVNSLMLPGLFVPSTYTYDDFPFMDLANPADKDATATNKRNQYEPKVRFTDKVSNVRGTTVHPLRLLWIPVDQSSITLADAMNQPGTHIPAVLQIAPDNNASTFVIHFHGNACDAAQVGAPARVESRTFNAHYLVVEYPGYGLSHGTASESLLNSIAFTAYLFVVSVLKIPPSRIVIYGRSVGSGLAVHLCAKLQALNLCPAAMILHSPYTSIRDVAKDVMGCTSNLFMNRWENWRFLGMHGDTAATAAAATTATATTAAAPVSTSAIKVTLSDKGAQDAGEDQFSLPAKAVLLPERIAELTAMYSTVAPRTIRSPVMLIHADKDQIIDHHHSAVLQLTRSRAGLPCELFTQRSTKTFRKDHNLFDYEKDVIRPVQEFLKKHHLLKFSPEPAASDVQQPQARQAKASAMSDITDGPGTGPDPASDPEVSARARASGESEFLQLDLRVVTQACAIPAQYSAHAEQVRAARISTLQAEKRKEEDAAAAEAADVARQPGGSGRRGTLKSAASFSSPRNSAENSVTSTSTAAAAAATSAPARTPAKPPVKEGVLGVFSLIFSGWNMSKCFKCCVCCMPCFCAECSVSSCSAMGSSVYYSLVDDEPDFEYTTKAHRRSSGGLKAPVVEEGDANRRLSLRLHTTQPPTVQEPTSEPSAKLDAAGAGAGSSGSYVPPEPPVANSMGDRGGSGDAAPSISAAAAAAAAAAASAEESTAAIGKAGEGEGEGPSDARLSDAKPIGALNFFGRTFERSIAQQDAQPGHMDAQSEALDAIESEYTVNPLQAQMQVQGQTPSSKVFLEG